MLESLTSAHFQAQLNRTFTFHVDGLGDVPMELTAVKILGAASPAGRSPFSVVFLAPAEPILPQGMYQVVNEQIGTIAGLFIVPIGRQREGARAGILYEAVFT